MNVWAMKLKSRSKTNRLAGEQIAERMEWIRLMWRNERKRLEAVSRLGKKWVLYLEKDNPNG